MQDTSEKTASEEANREKLLQQARKNAGSVLNKLPVAGPVVWLFMNTPGYKNLFIAELEWRLIPPLVLNQSKIYMKDEAPLAYVSWAFVDDEVEKRLLQGDNKLSTSEWQSGENLWVIDLVTPFGGARDVMKDLMTNIFPDKKVRQLVPAEDGLGIQPVEWPSSASG